MSFEIPTDLEPEVARYAEEAQVSSEEAVARLVRNGLRQPDARGEKRGSQPPVRVGGSEGSIGLFADLPDFTDVMERVIAGRADKYAR